MVKVYYLIPLFLIMAVPLYAKSDSNYLILSIKEGNVKIVKQLLEQGFNIDSSDDMNNTPLIVACQYNNIEIINLILERNPNVFAQNDDGKFAIDYAYQHRNKEVFCEIKKRIDKEKSKIKNFELDGTPYDDEGIKSWFIDEKDDNTFGYYFTNNSNYHPVKDCSLLKYYNIDVRDELVSYHREATSMFYIHIFFFYDLLIFGSSSVAFFIPATVLYILSGYYTKDDFMISGGKYYGVIGTVFMGLGGLLFIPVLIGLVIEIVNLAQIAKMKYDIKNEINTKLGLKRKHISINFEVRLQ